MDITSLTAVELGKKIKAKEISVVDAVKASIEQIEKVEKDVHSFVTIDREGALERAEEVQKLIDDGTLTGPLAGVPVAIKDNMCTKDMLTTCSSKILGNFKPTFTAEAVRNLEKAGAVIIGKTNMDEFAMGSTTETSYYGETKNPWNLKHVPGGSSGGSCAAVAAEECPYALGSDTGGSIRQPSSFCGVVGIKPTYGTVSRYGLIAYGSSLDQIGPIARDVTDCATILEAIASHDPKDSTSIAREKYDFTSALVEDVKGMKIGIPKDYFGEGLDPEVKEKILDAVKVLEEKGAIVEEFDLNLVQYAIPAYYVIASAEASSNLSRFDGVKYGYRTEEYEGLHNMYKKTRSEGFGPEVKRRIMLGSFVLSSGYYDAYYLKALRTKALIKHSTEFGGAPNTHTCPVCTGMPGSLPVLNKQVVEYAMAIGLATNCDITKVCKFDRKNYFYPDNPQNYQISQLYLPIARNGYVEIEVGDTKKKVRIHEMHMEEDAGKLIHDEWDDTSLVDYNRSGVPLVEIVSEPDMRSADEVIAYLEKLRMIIQYLGASDCKLQEGSMRADVNLSVREVGTEKFGTRTEMKNLNSFKAIARAIEGERERQIELLEDGKEVVQETRRWDDNKESSHAMRSKEDAQDYRYFPEPDLVPIVISDEWIEKIRSQQPEFRTEKLERYKKEFDIPQYDAEIITGSKHMADIFEATTAICKKPKKVSNWLMVETLRLLKDNDMEPEDIRFSPENLAKLIELTEAGTINSSVAKDVFEKIFAEDIDPEKYVEEHGLKTVNDEGALQEVLEKVIADNPQAVADYKGGKEKALGALVGQTMKAMKGKANPGMVNQKLKEMLS